MGKILKIPGHFTLILMVLLSAGCQFYETSRGETDVTQFMGMTEDEVISVLGEQNGPPPMPDKSKDSEVNQYIMRPQPNHLYYWDGEDGEKLAGPLYALALRFSEQNGRCYEIFGETHKGFASGEDMLRSLGFDMTKAESRGDTRMGPDFEIGPYEKVEVRRLHTSQRNYTKFFFTNGKRLIVSKTLKENEELLSQHNFIRPHKSHLINVKYIKSFLRQEGGYIIMTDGSKIPVSRRKREKIMDILMHL